MGTARPTVQLNLSQSAQEREEGEYPVQTAKHVTAHFKHSVPLFLLTGNVNQPQGHQIFE